MNFEKKTGLLYVKSSYAGRNRSLSASLFVCASTLGKDRHGLFVLPGRESAFVEAFPSIRLGTMAVFWRLLADLSPKAGGGAFQDVSKETPSDCHGRFAHHFSRLVWA
jgi:hypothetical protein